VDRDEMLRVFKAFETVGLEYVLIGAAAMGVHGLIRATEDIDILVRATGKNIERLRTALRKAYADDAHIDEIKASDLLGDYPAVRYYPPGGDLFFDIMTRLGEAASFDSVQAEVKEVEGVKIRVATPKALYRLKKDTIRPLDRRDAAALRERFDLSDDQEGS
jgi:acylphosphatase